ncbi:MAG: phenylacetate--CoA ligase family protein [Fimbriiglobus sp.]
MTLSAAKLQQAETLFRAILPANRFYAQKFGPSPMDFHSLPFTTKAEIVATPPLTRELSAYTRFHQSSGTTTGQPLRWYDTPASWAWVLKCWRLGFEILGLRSTDRLFFPFSFGPFLGFWSAFEAACQAGFFSLPAGGISSSARLKLIREHEITVIFCTPTYGLHLLEVAEREGLNLPASSVRALVVAGEPGGNLSGVRAKLEAGWGARVFDHYGMTEIGPVAFEPENRPRDLQILYSEFLPEVEGQELVLTNLGRIDCPLIRYRTGDIVELITEGNATYLHQGIRGRADDMLHIRGNNLYPSAIENLLRRYPEIAEFRIGIRETDGLSELEIEIEPTAPTQIELPKTIAQAIQQEFLFRPSVSLVPSGTLPRFEMKAKRWHKIGRDVLTPSAYN